MKCSRREFAAFVVCGGVTTALTYGIYVLGLLVMPYLASYAIGYASGIFIAYYLNSRFVFHRPLRVGKAIQYPAVYGAQYVLGTSLLYVLVSVLGVNRLVAPFFVVLGTVPVTFVLSRRVITAGPPGSERIGTTETTGPAACAGEEDGGSVD